MIWWDIFLLVAYGLIVYWVLTQAIERLDKQVTIVLNQEALMEGLVSRELSNTVGFNVGLETPCSSSTILQTLSLSISNISSQTLYIDWDRSTLTSVDGQSRRVIRLTSDTSLSLTRAQVWSIIPPGQVLQSTITAEDILTRSSETGSLEPTGMIVPMSLVSEDSPLTFHLYIWLVVQQLTATEAAIENRLESQYFIPFEFLIRKCPWTDALPW